MMMLVCSSFTYKLSTLMTAVMCLEKNIHIQEELHDSLAYACAAFADDKKIRNELFVKKELFKQTGQCSIQYVLQKQSIFVTITHQKSSHFQLRAMLTVEDTNNKKVLTYQLVS